MPMLVTDIGLVPVTDIGSSAAIGSSACDRYRV